MSEVKFTPGPWAVLDLRQSEKTIQRLTVVAREQTTPVICRIQNTVSGEPLDDGDVANAHLISAAPDLFEACQKILALHDESSMRWYQTNCDCDICKWIRPAITKAKSQSQEGGRQ